MSACATAFVYLRNAPAGSACRPDAGGRLGTDAAAAVLAGDGARARRAGCGGNDEAAGARRAARRRRRRRSAGSPSRCGSGSRTGGAGSATSHSPSPSPGLGVRAASSSPCDDGAGAAAPALDGAANAAEAGSLESRVNGKVVDEGGLVSDVLMQGANSQNSDGRASERERGLPSPTGKHGQNTEQSKGRPVSVGLMAPVVSSDLDQLILDVRSSRHDFAVVELLRPPSTPVFDDVPELRSADNINASVRRFAAHFNRNELQVRDADWSEYLVGRVADWLRLDSPYRGERAASELLLKKQIAWATYIGLSTLLFPLPMGEEPIANYVRCLNTHLPTMGYTQVWIRVPLLPAEQSTRAMQQGQTPYHFDKRAENASWERWNFARLMCEHSAKLRVALEITRDLPAPAIIDRWFAEPLSAALVPTDIFDMDKRGYPLLSRRHQSVIKRLIQHGCQVVIACSDGDSPLPTHPFGPSCYADYIRRLAGTLPPPSVVETFATGYQDYLQAPLQPLADNLEAATYATFEKDPVKYERYEEAVRRALLDRVCESDALAGKVTTVMVVGAGAKGPLVNCCIRASAKSGRKIKVHALEKNPNSLVTLQQMKEDVWFDQVSIVHADMRSWEAPEKADVLVSELLGSLGDNELSPECLDGAQKFLKDDGICIPASYTAYIAPLSSAKLYSEAAAYKNQLHLETPYVVMFKNVDHVAEPQRCWAFHHPNWVEVGDRPPPDNLHNTRYCHLTFSSAHGAMLHGLAGYFESVLYQDVMLSTLPSTHSPGMFSWFPLFFPLKNPLHVPAESTVDVHLWRLTDARKVWYEWSAAVSRPEDGTFLSACGISNAGGRSSWIGL